MRTTIDIDDRVLESAMKSGAYKTKKDVVEAGLRLIARQAVYRDLLALQGKLHWDGDAETWVDTPADATPARDDGKSAAVVAAIPVAETVVSGRAEP